MLQFCLFFFLPFCLSVASVVLLEYKSINSWWSFSNSSREVARALTNINFFQTPLLLLYHPAQTPRTCLKGFPFLSPLKYNWLPLFRVCICKLAHWPTFICNPRTNSHAFVVICKHVLGSKEFESPPRMLPTEGKATPYLLVLHRSFLCSI